MDSNGKKRVRINDKTTEIRSLAGRNDARRPGREPILNPLIPTQVVDEAFQRIFVVSLFVLIQSYKLYDLFMLNMGQEGDGGISSSPLSLSSVSRFSFLLKYSFIDGIFLWFLPILNISYLSFTPLITLVLTLGFNVTNVLLVSKFNLSLVLGIIGPYLKSLQRTRELTIGGESITSQAIDMDSHFKGKYTIQYLPDSLAKFNVFDIQPSCQNYDIKDPFQIPIEFNTTTDIGLIELQYTSPQNQVSYIKYTESDINRLLKKDYSHLMSYNNYVKDDDRVFYIEIPAYESGTYKINKIRDRKGISIRYIQKEFSFANCPNAGFVIPKAIVSQSRKICVGSKLDDLNMKLPLLTVDGVPPLQASILASFNDKKQNLITTNINLDIDNTDSYKFNFTNLFSHKITRNLLEQEILKNPNLLQVDESGTIQFQLLQIKDSLGNVKKYNPQSNSPDLRYNIDLLTKPSLRLIDYDPNTKLIVNGTKKIGLATSKNIREQLPLNVHFGYINPNDSIESFNFTHSFNEFNDFKNGIEIHHPGTYVILDVEGKWCSCDFNKSPLKVDIVSPPKVEIDAQPLMDKCVGMTGYNFKFDTNGEPPFSIDYSVYRNTSNGELRALPGPNGRINRILQGQSNNFEFNYKPPGEGNYAIVFKFIRDGNYQNPILLDQEKHTYLTYFKQRSKVSFFDLDTDVHIPKKTLRTCQGESTIIPIHFKGNFPFSFDYKITDSKTGKTIVSKANQHTNDPMVNIDTKDLITNGGLYKIDLFNIVDGISCAADFNSKESVEVFARSDVPTIEFDTSSKTTHHKIIEGSYIDIPLKVKSSVGRTSSDSIGYDVLDINTGDFKTSGTIRGTNNLRLSEPGIYKLTKFSNGNCPGKIDLIEKVIHVSFYNRPKLSVSAPQSMLDPISNDYETILYSGCQGCKREATVELEGKGPFIIDYEITFPSGRSDFRTMTTDKLSLTINLPSTQSGTYIHKFKGVYDALYTKGGPYVGKKLPIISYEIYQLPSIEFDKINNIQICEAQLGFDIPELGELPIKFNGRRPFSLNLSVTGDNLSKPKLLSIANITGSSLDLNNAIDSNGEFIWKGLNQGEYEISIDEIKDANGCQSQQSLQFNNLVISIIPAPDISKFKPENNHFCVGDHVGYDITGVPPFTMFYEFNGKQHKAKTSNQFRRLAAKTGTIRVGALEDSSARNCLINIHEDSKKAKELEITIHDLPSVEINQGDSIIQDIHEGEMTEMKFSFTGTPPFTLTYVRTLNPNSKARRSKNSKLHKTSKKITETTTVDNIWDLEYKVMVGLEGTYEAIEIRDAFCLAKKDFSF